MAGSWQELCRFDISNSVTDERAVCYVAWDLAHKAAAPEPSEVLTTKVVPFGTLIQMVMAGEISDSLTIVMTLMAYAKALRGEGPATICNLALEPLRGT